MHAHNPLALLALMLAFAVSARAGQFSEAKCRKITRKIENKGCAVIPGGGGRATTTSATTTPVTTTTSTTPRPIVEIDNHSQDANVTKLMVSGNVTLYFTPKCAVPGCKPPSPGTVYYDEDIIALGTDDEGNVLSFICPQVNNVAPAGTITFEIQVKRVGGFVDLSTGTGTIHASELSILVWGNVTAPYWTPDGLSGTTVVIEKSEAAKVLLRNVTGGDQFILTSFDGPFFSNFEFDQVLVGETTRGQSSVLSPLQWAAIVAVEQKYLGLTMTGTELGWDLDLKAPINMAPGEYQQLALAAAMGGEGTCTYTPEDGWTGLCGVVTLDP